MEKFLKKTRKIIFYRQNDIFSSVLILASMNLTGKILGFLRLRAYTVYFDEHQIEYILAAFRLPDIVFELLITGVLSAAFIPLFIKYEKDKPKLYENMSSIINFMLLLLTVFSVFAFFGANFIVPHFIPGYSASETSLVIYLTRWVILTQLPFLVIGYILSGMAQANKIFISTALAPLLYSLGSIIGTLVFSSRFGLFGPIIGAGFGAFLFLIIQTPTLLAINFSYHAFARKISAVKEFIRLFSPRVLAVMSTQIDLTVDLAISSFLSRGSYTIFLFAQKLYFSPIAFLGIPLAQAAFPYLSEMYVEKKIDNFRRVFINSILQLAFLTVPLGLFFIFARTPLIRIVFGGPQFSIEATSLSALTLSYYAFSIPFHTIYYLIIRSFYATYDTKTPLYISLANSAITICLSVFFIFFLKMNVSFLALSFSIAITFNVFVALFLFYRKIGGFDWHRLVKGAIKIYTAAFLAAFIAYPVMKILDLLILDTTHTLNVFFLILITFFLFVLGYLFFAWVFAVEEIYIIGKFLKTVNNMKRKFTEIYADVG